MSQIPENVSSNASSELKALTSSAVPPLAQGVAQCATDIFATRSDHTDLALHPARVKLIDSESTPEEVVTAVALNSLPSASAAAPSSPSPRAIPSDTSVAGVESFYTELHEKRKKYYDAHVIPESVKELTSKASEIRDYQTELTYSNPSLHTITVPTDEGIMLLTSYYKQKYGITILVAGSEVEMERALRGKDLPPDCKNWGVIVTNSADVGHVVPVLCHKNEDGKIEASSLDSLGVTAPYIWGAMSLYGGPNSWASQLPDINWSFAEEPRQADTLSCRTDALVMLKDALRSTTPEGSSPLQLSVTTGPLGRRVFTLPSFLGRTAQISKAIHADDNRQVTTKHKETFTDFRQRFTEEVTSTLSRTIWRETELDWVVEPQKLPPEVTTRKMIFT